MKYILLLLSFSVIYSVSLADNDNIEDGLNPFILIARIHIKEGQVENYLNIADEVDRAVEASEPGMLFHNFDSDPSDPLAYTWTEVYANSQAFLDHNANPPVGEYVIKHAEMGDGFTIEIYGNVSQDVIDAINALEIPLKHFKTSRVGYVRNERFKL
jgi:quinol monooxygenase YgiN